MSFFPRIANAFKAAKRAYFAAAETHRLSKGLRTQRGIGPDLPALTDGPTIRARIYELERNNAIMDNAIRAFVNGVLPTQIAVEPYATRRREDVPGDAINRAWNDPVAYLWNSWGQGACDFAGWDSHRETFAMLQRKVCRSVYTDTECFVVRRRRSGGSGMPRLQIEIIESDRLGYGMTTQTGAIGINDQRAGVEYDDTGRPAFYNFTRAMSYTGRLSVERIPAKDVLHVFCPSRPGAQAGKFSLASCLMAFFHTGNVVQAELEALDYLTRIAGVVTGDDSIGEEDSTDGDGNAFQLADTEGATIYRSSAQGNFTAFKVDRPQAGFDKTIETFTRWIAAGTGVPYSILAANYTGLNFTVSRAEMMSWKPTLTVWQEEILIAQFIQPVFASWFLEAALLDGLIFAPYGLPLSELTVARFRKPRREYVDPQTEIQADILAIQAGLTTPQEVCAMRGFDFYENIDQIKSAMDYAAKQGVSHLAIFSSPAGSAAPGMASDANNAVPPPQIPARGLLPDNAPDERRSNYG